jgi:septum formation protein
MRAKFILASSSPRRIDLLKSIGVIPDAVVPSHIDETPLKSELPLKYTERLAVQKAQAVASNYQDAIVLGADSIVAVGRRILGKPEDDKEAERFFKLLSGRRHKVITSVCMVHEQKTRFKTAITTVQFKVLTKEDIKWLIDSNEWQDKCGGYTILGVAGAFIKQIIGTHSNVIGLPIYETVNLLKSFGIKLGNILQE